MSDRTPSTSLERLLNRLYHRVLRLLPIDIRIRWAADMRAVFARRVREAIDGDGAAAAVGWAAREIGSITVAAFQTRVGQVTGRDHRARDAQDGSDVWRTDPVPALYFREDRRSLKLATVGALACHFALFMVVLPEASTNPFIAPPREAIPLTPLPPPPKRDIQPKSRIVRTVNPTPIPDPTPRDPEPIINGDIVYTFATTDPVSTDFAVDLPAAPPAPPQVRVRAGMDVERPQLLERIVPDYPELAVRARIECTAVLEAVIGRTGDVVDVDVLRGCPMGLDESALTAVRQWKYTPTTVGGRPVEVIAVVTVNFELR